MRLHNFKSMSERVNILPSKDSLVRAVSFKKEEAYMIEALETRFQPFSFSNCIKALILKEINGTNSYQSQPFIPIEQPKVVVQEVKKEIIVEKQVKEERVQEVAETKEEHQQTNIQKQEAVEPQTATLQYDFNSDREELSLDI